MELRANSLIRWDEEGGIGEPRTERRKADGDGVLVATGDVARCFVDTGFLSSSPPLVCVNDATPGLLVVIFVVVVLVVLVAATASSSLARTCFRAYGYESGSSESISSAFLLFCTNSSAARSIDAFDALPLIACSKDSKFATSCCISYSSTSHAVIFVLSFTATCCSAFREEDANGDGDVRSFGGV